MDYQFFSSRKAALEKAVTLFGWDTKIVEREDLEGKIRWVIQCDSVEREDLEGEIRWVTQYDSTCYLRDDGFVR